MRTTESVALHVLRGLEQEGIRRRDGEITVTAALPVALHLLNQMRERLVEIEQRYDFHIRIEADNALIGSDYTLARAGSGAAPTRIEAEPDRAGAPAESGKAGRGRRRRKKSDAGAGADVTAPVATPPEETVAEAADTRAGPAAEAAGGDGGEDKSRRRRRGKRGGRRRSRRTREGMPAMAEDAAAAEPSLDEAAAAGENEPDTAEAVQAVEAAETTDTAEAVQAVEAAETTETAEAAQAVEAAETTETAKPARRRRASRRRRPAKAAESPDAPQPVPSDTAPDEDTASPAPRRDREETQTAPHLAASGPGEGYETLGAGPLERAGPDAAGANGNDGGKLDDDAQDRREPDQPKRRGWWQRWT